MHKPALSSAIEQNADLTYCRLELALAPLLARRQVYLRSKMSVAIQSLARSRTTVVYVSSPVIIVTAYVNSLPPFGDIMGLRRLLPSTVCGTTKVPFVVDTVLPFNPLTCTSGTGAGNLEGLYNYSCNYSSAGHKRRHVFPC